MSRVSGNLQRYECMEVLLQGWLSILTSPDYTYALSRTRNAQYIKQTSDMKKTMQDLIGITRAAKEIHGHRRGKHHKLHAKLGEQVVRAFVWDAIMLNAKVKADSEPKKSLSSKLLTGPAYLDRLGRSVYEKLKQRTVEFRHTAPAYSAECEPVRTQMSWTLEELGNMLKYTEHAKAQDMLENSATTISLLAAMNTALSA